eukprot:4653694-Pleurochrysis_carterae.AAC.1
MASPSGARASEKFLGGARDAAAGLKQAVREAKRAAGGTTESVSIQPPLVQWAALSLSEWKKVGALSMFYQVESRGACVVHARSRRGASRHRLSGAGESDSAAVRDRRGPGRADDLLVGGGADVEERCSVGWRFVLRRPPRRGGAVAAGWKRSGDAVAPRRDAAGGGGRAGVRRGRPA